jgi:hypothetical protein
MRLAGYTSGIKNALVRNPDNLKNLGVDGQTILK